MREITLVVSPSRESVMIFVLAFSLVAQAREHASTPLPTEPRLQVFPLDLAEIRSITPLGNLNPRGGHVFPTDHIYLDYGGREGLPVRGPTSSRVFALRGQIRDDFKIEVQVNGRFSYYVAHQPVRHIASTCLGVTCPLYQADVFRFLPFYVTANQPMPAFFSA